MLARLQPTELALEEAFFGKSVQSALRVGEARGVILPVPLVVSSARAVLRRGSGAGLLHLARASDRANISAAMFAQAISRTMATEPSRKPDPSR